MAITGSVFAIKKHGFKIKADMKDGKQNASTQHIPEVLTDVREPHLCGLMINYNKTSSNTKCQLIIFCTENAQALIHTVSQCQSMQPIVSDSQDQYLNPKGILDLGIPFNSPQLPHSDTSEKEFEAPQSV